MASSSGPTSKAAWAEFWEKADRAHTIKRLKYKYTEYEKKRKEYGERESKNDEEEDANMQQYEKYVELSRQTKRKLMELDALDADVSTWACKMYFPFHLHCTTGHRVIDAEISKFITKHYAESEEGVQCPVPDIKEILEQIAVIAFQNSIDMDASSNEEMARKVHKDVKKQYRLRRHSTILETYAGPTEINNEPQGLFSNEPTDELPAKTPESNAEIDSNSDSVPANDSEEFDSSAEMNSQDDPEIITLSSDEELLPLIK